MCVYVCVCFSSSSAFYYGANTTFPTWIVWKSDLLTSRVKGQEGLFFYASHYPNPSCLQGCWELMWAGQTPVHGLGYVSVAGSSKGLTRLGMACFGIQSPPPPPRLLWKVTPAPCLLCAPKRFREGGLDKLPKTWGDLFPILPHSFPWVLLSVGKLWPATHWVLPSEMQVGLWEHHLRRLCNINVHQQMNG